MIAKILKGRDFGGLLRYLYGPARQDRDGRTVETHVNPRMVATNLPGAAEPPRDGSRCGYDVGALARRLCEVAAANRRVTWTVWHTSLSAAPEDLAAGRLRTDAEWGQLVEDYLRGMGLHGNADPLQDVPWLAVRHGDGHVHIVASRVRYDGRKIDDSYDRPRSMRTLRAIERRFGLVDPTDPARNPTSLATVTRTERELIHRAVGGGVEVEVDEAPARALVADRVQAAVVAAAGDVEAFHRELTAKGVCWRRSAASNGRTSGYVFGLVGAVDAAGQQRWYRGSKLHRDLAWSRLAPRLGEAPDTWRTPAPSPTLTPAAHQPTRTSAKTKTLVSCGSGAGRPGDELAERRLLASRVQAALDAACGDPDRFHDLLAAAGVAWRINRAGTGRVSGYAFAQADPAGHAPEAASARWYGGSKLHKSLAWSRLAPQLTSRIQLQPGDSGPAAALARLAAQRRDRRAATPTSAPAAEVSREQRTAYERAQTPSRPGPEPGRGRGM